MIWPLSLLLAIAPRWRVAALKERWRPRRHSPMRRARAAAWRPFLAHLMGKCGQDAQYYQVCSCNGRNEEEAAGRMPAPLCPGILPGAFCNEIKR